MKYLTRIALFFSLIMLFAVIASAEATEDTNPLNFSNSKTSGKQITIEKKTPRAVTYHYDDVWIESTWIDYVIDEDGDGFYHDFRFSFDADTRYNSQALYAVISLSNGNDTWPVFTSDTFWINGSSGSDVYQISTALYDGYPAGIYDLSVELFDAHSHEHLQSWDYLDDHSLANLSLEDSEHDTFFSSTPYVHSFDLHLDDDFDGDGFSSQIAFEIDVDAPGSISDIRIGVELYDNNNGWEPLFLSEEITITGNSSSDSEAFVIDLENGYPADLYILRITIYESSNRAILSTQTISQDVALESLDYEDDNDHRSSHSHGEGGALGWVLLPLFGLLVARRVKSKR